MGANTFFNQQWNPAVSDAFRVAVDEARWDRGHGGYTGTIGEKRDFVVIEKSAMTAPAAIALAERLINDCDPRVNDKWGPAGAIALTRQNPPSREITVKAVLRDDDAAKYSEIGHAALVEAAKAKLRAGEHVVDVTRTDQRLTTKLVVESNTAGSTLKYRVNGQIHDTMSEARKLQRDLLEDRAQKLREGQMVWGATEPIDIQPVKVAADGSLAVTSGRLLITRATLVGKARVESRRGGATVDGWLFFGWASS